MTLSPLYVKNECKDKSNNMKNKIQRKINQGRIICLMVIIGFIMANVTNLHAQTTLGQVKKNVKMTNVTVQQLVDKLGADFKYSFFIVDEKVSKTIVSVDVKNAPINQILDKAFEGKEIIYTIKDKSITIAVKKEQPKPKSVVKKISGVVTDKNGATIIGASVLLPNSGIGTMTNINGEFILNVPSDGILQVSYIGYVTEKVPINGQTKLSIQLTEDTKLLNEVVVVGYGTIKKSDLTGSVSQIRTDGIGNAPNTTMEQFLQGRVSGVNISQNTGAPGSGMSFVIRGSNSLSGNNQPLFIIDGMPIESGDQTPKVGMSTGFQSETEGGNALAGINPNDIESVEILKDASSTAIYGSRGANGVVIISTKRGKKGKDKISYSFRQDFSQLQKKINVLGTKDYMDYANEAYFNSLKPMPFTTADYEKYASTNTDWQDQIFQLGLTQDHQLSLSGGDDKLKYAISGNYTDQEGIVKYASRFQRGSVRINLDRFVGSRLKFGTSLSAIITMNNAAAQAGTNGNPGGSAILGGLLTRPIDKAFMDDEQLDVNLSGNPILVLQRSKDVTNVKNVLFNAFGEYTLADGLKFKINGGANYYRSIRDTYSPRGTYYGDQNAGAAYRGDNDNFNYLIESTLSYNKTFNKKHRINAVGGYTFQRWQYRSLGITALQFPNDNLYYYNLGNANAIVTPRTTYGEYALESVLGRANYSFNERFLATITIRNDGSTRLAEGYKWAMFPSFALGWNVHSEPFIKRNIHELSELKLRASYGTSGNQSIGVGATKATYIGNYSVLNGVPVFGYQLGNLSNSLLSWEKTKQFNIGVDLGLLENRFTFGFNYYYKITTDLLFQKPIAPSTGFTTYSSNAGEIENTGYEFELGAHLLSSQEFKWNLSGNLSINRNKVLSLAGQSDLQGPIGYFNGLNQSLHISRVGYPIGSFFGYKFDGLYQNQAEITNGPDDSAVKPEPGLWKFKDFSGPNGVPDNKITAADQTIIGNPYPDFTFGINNNFSYKRFSLAIFIMGSIGQDVINLNRYILNGMDIGMYPNNISQEAYDNRWTGEGTSNTYAKPRNINLPFYKRFSDFLVEDASFIRLKNVTFSYEVPVEKLKFLKKLSVFVTGTNLITITNYSGYDPEISSQGNTAQSPGLDFGAIPMQRVYSCGINLGF